MTSRRRPSVEAAGLSSRDSACGKLQRICLELLQEHECDGALPTSSCFLAYELIQRGILSNEKKDGARRGDQNLHDALTALCEIGLVSWEWITDETRSLSDYTGRPTISNWVTHHGGAYPPRSVGRQSAIRTHGEPFTFRRLGQFNVAICNQVGRDQRSDAAGFCIPTLLHNSNPATAFFTVAIEIGWAVRSWPTRDAFLNG